MEVICCVRIYCIYFFNFTCINNFNHFLVDEIQVASYKILAALYTLGTDLNLTHDRKYLKTEFERHKPVNISFP